MNKKIGIVGSIINVITVLIFAICMLVNFDFGSYFSCIFLALSFVMMMAAFENECSKDNKVAGKTALIFAGIYATLILIVYFTQCTTVMNEQLSADLSKILDYKNTSFLFNLDLLGYGIMALSTFFIGLTIDAKNKKDKVLKWLLLIHGVFFISCLIMPTTGMFTNSDGPISSGGIIALEIWCAYFLPIGILSYLHFRESKK